MAGDVEVFISCPLVNLFKDEMMFAMETLKGIEQTDDGSAPKLKLFKFTEVLVNIVLKHLINDHETDVIRLLKEVSPEDYRRFCEVANDMKDTINSLVMDIPFTCERMELINNGDMTKLMIRFDENEL